MIERAGRAMRKVTMSLLLSVLWTATATTNINVTIDMDVQVAMPVNHRYIHGVIPDDAKFQLALPEKWNGKLVVFSRGFSGTELTTGAFKTTALEKAMPSRPAMRAGIELQLRRSPRTRITNHDVASANSRCTRNRS